MAYESPIFHMFLVSLKRGEVDGKTMIKKEWKQHQELSQTRLVRAVNKGGNTQTSVQFSIKFNREMNRNAQKWNITQGKNPRKWITWKWPRAHPLCSRSIHLKRKPCHFLHCKVLTCCGLWVQLKCRFIWVLEGSGTWRASRCLRCKNTSQEVVSLSELTITGQNFVCAFWLSEPYIGAVFMCSCQNAKGSIGVSDVWSCWQAAGPPSVLVACRLWLRLVCGARGSSESRGARQASPGSRGGWGPSGAPCTQSVDAGSGRWMTCPSCWAVCGPFSTSFCGSGTRSWSGARRGRACVRSRCGASGWGTC